MKGTHLITNRIGRQYYIYDDDKLYQQRLASYNGPYQMRNMQFIRKLIPHPNTIIDIGMNIGMNTIEYATFAKQVIGFEPFPKTFKLAEMNIKHNQTRKVKGRYFHRGKYVHLENYEEGWWKENGKYVSLDMTGKIEIHNIGLGEIKEEKQMVHHPKDAGHNYIKLHDRKLKNKLFKINVTTLDSFGFDNIDAIKIDTEGFELFIIQGGVNTIKKCRPIVQVEVVKENFKRMNYKPQDLLDYFFKTFDNYIFCDYTGIPLGKKWKKIEKVMDYFFVPKKLLKTSQSKLDSFYKKKK